jgi:hypothetical protein
MYMRLAATCVASLVLVALAWSFKTHIVWEISPVVPLVPGALLLPVVALANWRGRLLALSETVFYFVVHFTSALFAVQISYLAFSLGMPLQDRNLAKLDSLVGFSWIDWAGFLSSHDSLASVLEWSYVSIKWQAFILIPLLALFRPKSGNWTFFISVFIAMLLTLSLTAIVPAIGPGDVYGFAYPPASIIRALRDPAIGAPLPYAGIVSFPSFHTVMAILFTYAVRGLPLVFPLTAALNATMLIAIPYSGDHYIVDMLGGALVAWLSLRLTSAITIRLIARTTMARDGRRFPLTD